MASPLTHTFSALIFSNVFSFRNPPLRLWILGIICSIFPDLDIISFSLGISYADFWGHRGFSHSLVFAVILALLVTALFFDSVRVFSKLWVALFSFFFVCTASHGILDAMTNGGLGVAFFSPLDDTRYFLPWRPLQVSPISIGSFFSEWGMLVLETEFKWVWLPGLILVLISSLLRSYISKI